MNEEQTAIANTIEQWTPLAETGEDKPELEGVLHDCHLCDYASEMKEDDEVDTHRQICKYCPYYKKYGQCYETGKPFQLWRDADSRSDRCRHAAAFLAQVETLQETNMIDVKGTELSEETIAHYMKKGGFKFDKKPEPEPEKPKPLEHGDVRLSTWSQSPFLIYNKEVYWLGKYPDKETARPLTDDVFAKSELLFNLADDLQALGAEPLEEFTVKSTFANGKFNVKFNAVIAAQNTGINLDIPSHPFSTFAIEDVEEIHRKLGRLIHKAKQDAAKSK